MRRALLLVAGLVAGLVGAACAERPRQEILVSAASSLTEAFGAIAVAFEGGRPGVDVTLNLGGSSALREQILAGAPADVFASADLANLERIAAAGGIAGEPRVFARNRLQIAVPAGNPGGVSGLADFADERLLIGLCAAAVPCGALARAALRAAGVEPAADTHEPSARALVGKLAARELDAGLVYQTDVAANARVAGIDLPSGLEAVAEYAIAVLAAAPHPAEAAAFAEFVLGEEGRRILAGHGFAPP